MKKDKVNKIYIFAFVISVPIYFSHEKNSGLLPILFAEKGKTLGIVTKLSNYVDMPSFEVTTNINDVVYKREFENFIWDAHDLGDTIMVYQDMQAPERFCPKVNVYQFKILFLSALSFTFFLGFSFFGLGVVVSIYQKNHIRQRYRRIKRARKQRTSL